MTGMGRPSRLHRQMSFTPWTGPGGVNSAPALTRKTAFGQRPVQDAVGPDPVPHTMCCAPRIRSGPYDHVARPLPAQVSS